MPLLRGLIKIMTSTRLVCSVLAVLTAAFCLLAAVNKLQGQSGANQHMDGEKEHRIEEQTGKSFLSAHANSLDNVNSKYVAGQEERHENEHHVLHPSLPKLPMATRSGKPHWDEWKTWSKPRSVYPATPFKSRDMRQLLHDMATRKIMHAKVGFKGTQLKMVLVLEGGQEVVFKPKRFDRDFTIIGYTYSGFDRHNAEIAGFYLDGILGFHRAPPVVGRVVNLNTEILPVAEDKLKKTFFNKSDDVCFYGVCMYCKKELSICAKGGILEGSVTLWLPNNPSLRKWRHPYQRTYIEGKKAKWEIEENFCKKSVLTQGLFQKGPRLLDIMDATVLDYLMGNADRHHYETIKSYGDAGMLLLLDNAKSFGNAYVDDQSVLTPLVQCCRMRKSTWKRLLELHGSTNLPLGQRLEWQMSIDPVAPVLYHTHLTALNRRLGHIVNAMRHCIATEGEKSVLRGEAVEEDATMT